MNRTNTNRPATYAKANLAHDDRGFYRFVGYQPASKTPARFRLGKDESRARIAVAKIEQLFARADGTWNDPLTLALAKAIAKGEQEFTLAPNPDMSGAESYAHWIDRYAVLFGDLIRIIPTEPNAYEHGRQEIKTRRHEARERIEIDFPLPNPSTDQPHERLHHALDAYAEYLATKPDQSGWSDIKRRMVLRLKMHHADIPLSSLTLDKMEQQLAHWANRPQVINRNKRTAHSTALNHMKLFRDFWKWLHRADAYNWKRPDGHEDLKPRIVRLPNDLKPHVEVFSIADLTSLYKNASRLTKCFILLGMNCGFCTAEIARLTLDEIFLEQPHPHARRLSLDDCKGNWVLRVRHKSSVYGEWSIWQETADALRWAIARKNEINPQSKIVFLTKQGKPLNAKTMNGNKSARIANLWVSLFKKTPIKFLPFKHVRKTAGDLIRQVSDGEIAGVFLTHGQPVKSDALADVYTNRPFLKVFDAIGKVGEMLRPMFAK